MLTDSGIINADEANWNNYINPGVYSVISKSGNTIHNGLNAPSDLYPWGLLIVFRSMNCVAQIYIAHEVTTIDFRITYNYLIESSWRSWRKL